MLGVRLVHTLLDAGIDLGGTGLIVGLIHLRYLCALYNSRFSMTNVVILNLYSDCEMTFSGNNVSLCLSNDPCAKGAATLG